MPFVRALGLQNFSVPNLPSGRYRVELDSRLAHTGQLPSGNRTCCLTAKPLGWSSVPHTCQSRFWSCHCPGCSSGLWSVTCLMLLSHGSLCSGLRRLTLHPTHLTLGVMSPSPGPVSAATLWLSINTPTSTHASECPGPLSTAYLHRPLTRGQGTQWALLSLTAKFIFVTPFFSFLLQSFFDAIAFHFLFVSSNPF